MTEYRFGHPGDEEDILDFINLVFSQAARPHHFDRLLPKVYAHSGYAPLHALAVTEGRIRGCVAVLPLTVRLHGETLQGGYVGSVSVHERARGEGHMKALMRMQIEAAQARGDDFLILGGRRQRYGYYGFENIGGMAEFSINADNVRHALAEADGEWVAFRQVEGPQDRALRLISALHAAQPYRCDRPAQRLYDTLTSWEAEPFVISHRETGEFRGYLIAADSRITELVLVEEGDLPAVIKAWMRGRKGCAVLAPLWQRARVNGLKAFAENGRVGDEEMIKVLCWPRVLSAALRMQQAVLPLPEGTVIVEIAGQRLALTVDSSRITVAETDQKPDRVLTEKQAAALFFSPLSALMEGNALLRAWLPLPLGMPPADQF